MHDPTEHVQEHIQHTAAHGDHAEGHGDSHGHASQWITTAALAAAIFAAFAAIAGTLATSHLTRSTHKRIDANDQWSYYQSKSLKNYLLQAENDIIEASTPSDTLSPKIKSRIAANTKKIAENEDAKNETTEKAKEFEHLSAEHLDSYETYEYSATMFHIAIAIVAIAVVAKRRTFFYVSLIASIIGLVWFTKACIVSPALDETPKAATATEHPPAAHAPNAEHAANETPAAHPAEAAS